VHISLKHTQYITEYTVFLFTATFCNPGTSCTISIFIHQCTGRSCIYEHTRAEKKTNEE